MDTNWASEHLQLIRTLMERSTLYRRALAPIMIASGFIGMLAAVLTCFIKVDGNRKFSLYWLAVSVVAFVASFLLVRRQAIKESEPLWSLPTQRVTQALFPAFFLGFVGGIYNLLNEQPSTPWFLALVWVVAYGCALHAAGFFMQRGIKLFGWAFIVSGSLLLLASPAWPQLRTAEAAHCLMGVFFGVFHLGYGVYLYFTEKRRTDA
jgi:hypothetical protein